MSSTLNAQIINAQMEYARQVLAKRDKDNLHRVMEVTGDDDYDMGIGEVSMYFFKIIFCMKH